MRVEGAWLRRHWLEIAVFALALAIRLLYLLESRASPTFATPIIDAYHHVEIARNLAFDSGGSALFTGGRPFFYPLFVSAVFAVFGPSLLTVKVLQALLGAITCTLTLRLGTRIADRRVGLLASLMVVFYGPLFFWELEFVGAGWAAFWGVWLCTLLLRVRQHPTTPVLLVLGASAALAIMTRSEFALFVLAATVWLVWALRRDADSPEALGRPALALALGFLLVAAPVGALVQRGTGRPSLVPAVGTLNLYLGNNTDRCRTLDLRPGPEFQRLVDEPLQHGYRSTSERSRYFAEQVGVFIATEPASFFAGLARKAGQYVDGREVPRNIDIYLFREWSPLLAALTGQVGGFGHPWGLVFPFCALGLGLCWRRLPAPILLFCSLYPLLSVLVFVAGRYRVPIVPVVCLVAAVGFFEVLDCLRGGRGLRAGLAIVVAIALALAPATLTPACEETIDYRADLYTFLGTHALDDGDVERARHYLEIALLAQPGAPRAHYETGRVAVQEARYPQAVAHLDLAVAGRRSYLDYYGRAVARLGSVDRDGALSDLDEALRLAPDYGPALLLQGDLLFDAGRTGEARTRWERALDADAGSAEQARLRLERYP